MHVVLNNKLTSADMNMIFIYSARKIITKEMALNSVLKPLTSSDSPSEKSNGERFDSAMQVTNSIDIAKNRNVLRTELLFIQRE